MPEHKCAGGGCIWHVKNGERFMLCLQQCRCMRIAFAILHAALQRCKDTGIAFCSSLAVPIYHRCMGLLLLLLSLNARADWLDAKSPLVVPPRPSAEAHVSQNPPLFTWARFPGATGYQIELRTPSGNVEQISVQRNWWAPSRRMTEGRYEWRVQPAGVSDNWSDWRNFQIDSTSVVYIVPDDGVLIKRILAKPAPRGIDFGPRGESGWKEELFSKRYEAIQRLTKEVQSQLSVPVLVETRSLPMSPNGPGKGNGAGAQDIRKPVDQEVRRLKSAALLWRITRERQYLDEALRRGRAIAALNPQGPTSYHLQDQASREIMWSLAYTLDVLGEQVPIKDMNQWRAVVRERLVAMSADLQRDNWRLQQYPLDSHGVTNTAYLVATSVLTLGDIPESQSYLTAQLRYYAFLPSPWGGDDGGFANGTAYAEYELSFFTPLWDAIKAAAGIDLYASGWSRGFVEYLVGFLPPGAPTHVFGDAAETAPFTPAIKEFAKRVPSPLAAWYATNLSGKGSPINLLSARPPLPAETIEPAPPKFNSLYVRSIGWVAMHSDITDVGRTSVFFKSSPFGSFNHSHADQNSFVLDKGGMPLLVDSGRYDWYGSPQWKNWYRQTVAHNAITFDGDKGQVTEGFEELLKANGHIDEFSSSPSLDFAEGDATRAYGGVLTLALRRIWYLRSLDAVVVWDKVEAPIEHSYEWNLHAPGNIENVSVGSAVVRNGAQVLCITSLSGNDLVFGTRQEVPGSSRTDVSHAYFAVRGAKKSTEFLFLLDLGCKKPQVSVHALPTGTEVIVNKESIVISR